MRKLHLTLFACLIGCFYSCRHDEKPGWDVNVLTPLIKSTLTIFDMVADSIRKTNPDHSISLVYGSPLASLSIDSSLKLPDTSNQANIKLNTLTLDPVTVVNTITFEQLAALSPDSTLLKMAMALGISVPIPAIGPIIQNNIPFDFGNYFQTMTITDGIVDIKINNRFPIPFTNVKFSIRNQGNDSLIFQENIPLIAANDSVSVTSHIGSKTIEGKLYATIEISSPGSTSPQKLNPKWSITSTLSLHDVVIYSAVAKFPPQTVVHDANVNSYNLEGFEFHKIMFKKGIIRIEVYNTLPSPLHYTYTIPSASLNGVSFSVEGTVPAAVGGQAYHSTEESDLTGYVLDLRGIAPIERAQNKDLNNNGKIDSDTINTFYNEVNANITQTTPLIPLSLNDSIYIRGEFIGLVPQFGEGFLGDTMITIADTADFENVLSKLNVKTLRLDSVHLNLTVKNRIGAEAGIRVEQITAINRTTGAKADLQGYPVGQIIHISKPVKPSSEMDTVISSFTVIELKTGQCNIEKLLEIIPDQFICRISAFINGGKTPPLPGTGTDFIYYGQGIEADIDVSIPLSFVAEGICLNDTTTVNVENINTSEISDHKFQVLTENGFPLDASLQIYIANQQYQIIDSLMPLPGIIAAAIIDSKIKRVVQPSKSIIKLDLSNEKIEKMKVNNILIIKAVFNTKPDLQFVRIFDDYQLTVRLAGNFKYRVK